MNSIVDLELNLFRQALEGSEWSRDDLKEMKVAIIDTISHITLQIDERDLDSSGGDLEAHRAWKNQALRARAYERQKVHLVDLKLGTKPKGGGWLVWRAGRWLAVRKHPIEWLIEILEEDPEASVGEYHHITSQQWDMLPATLDREE